VGSRSEVITEHHEYALVGTELTLLTVEKVGTTACRGGPSALLADRGVFHKTRANARSALVDFDFNRRCWAATWGVEADKDTASALWNLNGNV